MFKLDKNKTKIIVATISTIGLIIVACIGLKQNPNNDMLKSKNNDLSSKQKTTNSNKKNNLGSVTSNSDNIALKDHQEDIIKEDAQEDSSSDNIEETNIEGNNSGTVLNGDFSGNRDIIINNIPDEQKNFEENVSLTGEISKSIIYGENNEIIETYYNEKNIPICKFEMLNENNVPIDIDNIYVEVINCNVFNEFIDDNIPPYDWATMEKMIFWSCNISPESRRYQSILLGYDENNIENKTEYVHIESNDTGVFKIKISPSMPGIYETNIIVEYTSYNKEKKEIVLPDINFTYDPFSGLDTDIDLDQNIIQQ